MKSIKLLTLLSVLFLTIAACTSSTEPNEESNSAFSKYHGATGIGQMSIATD